MKKRRVLKLEQLEARETPDVSLCHAAACPLQPLPTKLAVVGENPVTLPDPSGQAELSYPLQQVNVAGSPAPAANETEVYDWQELRAILADSRDLAQLLASSPVALRRAQSSPSLKPDPVAGQGGKDSDAPQCPSPDAELAAWRFLCNYTRKAIGNEEMKYGNLPDHEDIIHQTFVEWREQVGPGEKAFSRLLNKESAERQVLRKTVRRVIDHTRYEQHRQKRLVELIDQPAPVKPGEQDWIDLRIDWSLGVGNLSSQEKQMLELRRQGKTFAEIGSELGMMKQRVFEIYSSAVDYLQDIYCQ